ncbi:MAG: hypothetical protein AAF311_14320 [Pseudomonadota bacterium]
MIGLMAGAVASSVGNSVVERAKALRLSALEEVKAQADFERRSQLQTSQNEFSAQERQKDRDWDVAKMDLQAERAAAAGPDWSLVTPEEAEAMGLPADKPFQRSRDGKVSAIGGGGTNVAVDLGRGETEYDRTVGKANAEYFVAIRSEEQAARRALNSLDVMERAMSDPGFYSGAGVERVAQLKKFGAALGLNADGISSMETFNAQAKSAALDTMGGSLGAGFSNADRSFVTEQVPGLENTPEGNRKLIAIQRAINQRKLDMAREARAYAERNDGRIDIGFDSYIADWAEANPLFKAPPETSPEPSKANQPQGGRSIEDIVQDYDY